MEAFIILKSGLEVVVEFDPAVTTERNITFNLPINLWVRGSLYVYDFIIDSVSYKGKYINYKNHESEIIEKLFEMNYNYGGSDDYSEM